MKTQAGYTIVELVAVMVLLGILSVSVIPRFFDSDTYKELGFQDTLASDIRFAQKMARFSGCEVQVLTTANGYSIFQRAACTSGSFNVPVSRIGGQSDPIVESTPTNVVLTAIDFYFDSRGRPWDTAAVTLWAALQDLTVGTRTLRIEAETGYAHWL